MKMRKNLIALLLSTSAVVAHAEPVSYQFSYEGLRYYETGLQEEVWVPNAKISGSYTAEDRDGSGYLETSELLSLRLKSDLTEFYFLNGVSQLTSSASRVDVYFVQIDPRILEIRASYTWFTSDGAYARRDEIGVSYWGASTGSNPVGSMQVYSSTDQSTFVSSVPEPSTAAMSIAGLALLGFAARRQKQR
jgi:hypothetical protein